ncbi:MAG: DsbA family protein [Spirochaetaceae bacterium]|nr:DsbA family protein [Spirochaetaceae bacterium]
MADLYAAAAPAIEGYEADLRRCQIDAERGWDEVLQAILRDLVHVRLRALEADRLGITADAVAERIERRAAGYGALERRYSVAYLLEPLRYDVAADGFPAAGPPDAPVTIVEFSDFECPYCARLLPILEQAQRQYGDKLRVVYRHYPLTGIHPNAWTAAEASLCAGEQGRFWQLHDVMFAEQGDLAVDALRAKAERLDLDTVAFGRCLDSGRHYDAVLADVRAGDALGVSGTPAMFVNGRFIGGAVPFSTLAAIVDDELRRLGM